MSSMLGRDGIWKAEKISSSFTNFVEVGSR
jgi:hypothetical protein